MKALSQYKPVTADCSYRINKIVEKIEMLVRKLPVKLALETNLGRRDGLV